MPVARDRDGQRLPRQRGLVEDGFVADDGAVGGHDLAGAHDDDVPGPELVDVHLLDRAVDVPVRDPRGALDEEAELAAGAAGGPRLECGAAGHHQRDDRGGEELAERERPDDRHEGDRVDADVSAQRASGPCETTSGTSTTTAPAAQAMSAQRSWPSEPERRRRRRSSRARSPAGPGRAAAAPARGGRRRPRWRYQLLASVRSCGRATRMRASTTTARSGRPITGLRSSSASSGRSSASWESRCRTSASAAASAAGAPRKPGDEPARLARRRRARPRRRPSAA